MNTDNKKRRHPVSISWDDLENAYVCEQGYCYRTMEDIPEDLRHLVQDGSELHFNKNRTNSQRQKMIDGDNKATS